MIRGNGGDANENFSELRNNLALERAVLGCVLLDPSTVHVIVDEIDSHVEAFTDARTRATYQVYLSLADQGVPIDVLTVTDAMRRTDEREPDTGWLEYVTELSGAVPTSANARHYAHLLMRRHMTRRCVDEFRTIVQSNDPEPLVESSLSAIQNLIASGNRQSVRPIARRVDEPLTWRQLASGYPTGYPSLDDVLHGGLKSGEMTVLAGRPSHGKTSFALNVAHHIGRHQNVAVLLVSLEMNCDAIRDRLIQIEGGINVERIYRGECTPADAERARDACNAIAASPIYGCDETGMTVDRISHRAVAWARQHPRRVIVIDYLQLIAPAGKTYSREYEVAAMSKRLKLLARDAECPVLVCCQLNRESEQQTNHYKKLAYLRESGSIEQDADVVMILTQATDTEKDRLIERNVASARRVEDAAILCVAKHRNGPTGLVYFHFDKGTQIFSEL